MNYMVTRYKNKQGHRRNLKHIKQFKWLESKIKNVFPICSSYLGFLLGIEFHRPDAVWINDLLYINV